ncbi:MAG: ferritin-like domain-containing protein [Actinomycetota bacterium]|nr:ferritin-like domain-containing protein [Actinomycetota bacterium]
MTPLEALQVTLAGEHAAIYVYAVLGGRVSVSADPAMASRLVAGYTTHRARRDQLVAMVTAVGAEPAVAETSYELPNPSLVSAQLERAALETEQRCTAVYADMVASTSRANRQWAIDALTDSAVRQLGFGGDPSPFPGVSELTAPR